jgi:hypothetical protein
MRRPSNYSRILSKIINTRKKKPPADAELLAGLPGPNARAMLLPIMKKHCVFWSEMVSDRRQKIYTNARQDMYARLRQEDWSYTRIGHLFHRDHTTILSGVRSWESRNGIIKESGDMVSSLVPFVWQCDAGLGDTLAVKS